MKKIIILIIILTLAAAGAFAQSNIIYGGPGGGLGVPFLGDIEVFVSYEYAVIPQLTIGASAALQMYPLALYGMAISSAVGTNSIKNIFSAVLEGQVHWYPSAKSFHLDLGLGYSNYLESMHSLLIAPGLGWLIDFNEPGGFVMNIGLRTEVFLPIGGSFAVTDEGADFTPFNFSLRLGLGYRF